jgi:hypothetical protein
VDGDGIRLLEQDVDLVVERVFAKVAHGDEHLLVLAVFHEVVELLVDLTGDEVHLFPCRGVWARISSSRPAFSYRFLLPFLWLLSWI